MVIKTMGKIQKHGKLKFVYLFAGRKQIFMSIFFFFFLTTRNGKLFF